MFHLALSLPLRCIFSTLSRCSLFSVACILCGSFFYLKKKKKTICLFFYYFSLLTFFFLFFPACSLSCLRLLIYIHLPFPLPPFPPPPPSHRHRHTSGCASHYDFSSRFASCLRFILAFQSYTQNLPSYSLPFSFFSPPFFFCFVLFCFVSFRFVLFSCRVPCCVPSSTRLYLPTLPPCYNSPVNPFPVFSFPPPPPLSLSFIPSTPLFLFVS